MKSQGSNFQRPNGGREPQHSAGRFSHPAWVYWAARWSPESVPPFQSLSDPYPQVHKWLFYFQALPLYFQVETVVKGEGKSASHQIVPAMKELSEAPPSNIFTSLSPEVALGKPKNVPFFSCFIVLWVTLILRCMNVTLILRCIVTLNKTGVTLMTKEGKMDMGKASSSIYFKDCLYRNVKLMLTEF